MSMLNSFFIAALLAFMLTDFCSQLSTKSESNNIQQSTSTTTKPEANHLPHRTDPRNLFTLPDAEKILGEPSHLVDSGYRAPGVGREDSPKDSVLPIKKTASSWGCSYEAKVQDEKTGRTGKIYFVVEQYPQASSATTVYSYYRRSNETHPGFKALQGPGWEGWHGNSPLFVYLKKENRVLIMKVNKMTSKTSASGFDEVVEKVAKAF